MGGTYVYKGGTHDGVILVDELSAARARVQVEPDEDLGGAGVYP